MRKRKGRLLRYAWWCAPVLIIGLLAGAELPDVQFLFSKNLKGEAHGSEDSRPDSGSGLKPQEEEWVMAPHGWKMIWNDEFNGDALDLDKWIPEDWKADKNKELQYYLPHNVSVQDGALNIVSRRESYKGRAYTSGAVHTKGTFSFQYGRVEMRAKLPGGQGIFPAFWMMPDKRDAWLPEIDIVEMLGQKPHEIWMVFHREERDGKITRAASYKENDFTKDFHTYSLEWTPEELVWAIDGIERFRIKGDIPREKMYLYANTAVGGNWPGKPDGSTIFPVSYLIDYIRVYQRTEGDV
ncbi:family 16 glycosylhydrolase [Peribacillus sp. SCS-26]|uniref:glycoside hydrolase family 16 protein n=1 Tax=Paraperibacillus marinus TaxID=3115295 RepID=UPI00390638C0